VYLFYVLYSRPSPLGGVLFEDAERGAGLDGGRYPDWDNETSIMPIFRCVICSCNASSWWVGLGGVRLNRQPCLFGGVGISPFLVADRCFSWHHSLLGTDLVDNCTLRNTRHHPRTVDQFITSAPRIVFFLEGWSGIRGGSSRHSLQRNDWSLQPPAVVIDQFIYFLSPSRGVMTAERAQLNIGLCLPGLRDVLRWMSHCPRSSSQGAWSRSATVKSGNCSPILLAQNACVMG